MAIRAVNLNQGRTGADFAMMGQQFGLNILKNRQRNRQLNQQDTALGQADRRLDLTQRRNETLRNEFFQTEVEKAQGANFLSAYVGELDEAKDLSGIFKATRNHFGAFANTHSRGPAKEMMGNAVKMMEFNSAVIIDL